MDALELVGRDYDLFVSDMARYEKEFNHYISNSRFLVVGGAGSIGQAVVKQLFAKNPRALHVVDISENNLVELVRDLRSSAGYIDGDFRTFALDFGSYAFYAMLAQQEPYDYVLNLAALKHVRSEEDPFTLMRLTEVNVLHTEKLRAFAEQSSAKKYFCVSTDKATNPVNMMGCSKRIMEQFIFSRADNTPVSTARFANVAFSDGSLLHGFNHRLSKDQPLSAPNDVRRYFVTQRESGFLCLASCLLGNHREIFFPKLDEKTHQITFSEIAERFLRSHDLEPVLCETEQEARDRVLELKERRQWPVYFFSSDTTGEKPNEEFYQDDATIDWSRFDDIGVIAHPAVENGDDLNKFTESINQLCSRGFWSKNDLLSEYARIVPEFSHFEAGRYLDGRM